MVLFGRLGFSILTLAFFAVLRKLYIWSARLKKDSSLQRLSRANNDFISQLPDDILISILGRLPIKSAIRTSILSQRWRNLHRFVTSIDLDCGLLVDDYYLHHHNFHNSKRIIDSVHRFLRLWTGSKIRTFRLSCCLNKSATRRLKQCIYFLGRLGVEKLFLRCSLMDSSDLSFSCHLLSEMPSLRYFHLTFCSLHPGLKSKCNALKTLFLCDVTLLPGAMDCVLSNCLRLKTLVINSCKSPSKLSFRGPHLQLKTLEINVCRGLEEIDLYADNLVSFEYFGNKEVNFIFDYVPRLESVCLNMYQTDIFHYVGRKLSKDLSHLKSLYFFTCGDIYQESSRLMGINMFNLRELELCVYSVTRFDLLLLTPLWQSCPLLQVFHLHAGPILEYDLPRREKQDVVFHSKLKEMELSGFVGTKNDIEFALYILKSATSLEKMLISRHLKMYHGSGWWTSGGNDIIPWSDETQNMIQRQLEGQAVSKSAQVIIQHEADIEDCDWIDSD